MKEFHRRDFANRTGLAQAWTVKSADRLFTQEQMPKQWQKVPWRSVVLCNYRRHFWKQETSYRSPRRHDIVTSLCKKTMKRRKKLKERASDVLLVRRAHGPQLPLHFLLFFLLRAPFGQYGPVAAFELYLYTAVDSRPGPGGSRTTASCQP